MLSCRVRALGKWDCERIVHIFASKCFLPFARSFVRWFVCLFFPSFASSLSAPYFEMRYCALIMSRIRVSTSHYASARGTVAFYNVFTRYRVLSLFPFAVPYMISRKGRRGCVLNKENECATESLLICDIVKIAGGVAVVSFFNHGSRFLKSSPDQ